MKSEQITTLSIPKDIYRDREIMTRYYNILSEIKSETRRHLSKKWKWHGQTLDLPIMANKDNLIQL